MSEVKGTDMSVLCPRQARCVQVRGAGDVGANQMNIVQFIHPGGEVMVPFHNLGSGQGYPVGWNTGNQHSRRLLCHGGEYVDSSNNSKQHDSLCFWNEYEACTTAYPIQHHPGWEYARCYHQIVKPISQSPNRHRNCHDDGLSECCDNTDPCVFGDTFKYSNCQQVPGGDLWNLPQGSLILFGSFHASCFYLDTVFVTHATGIRYSVPIVNHQLPFAVSNNYRIVTLDNLMPRPNNRSRNNAMINEFMFYRGELPHIIAGKVDENHIFSFTPTRILGAKNYNERCKIDLAALNTNVQPHVPNSRGFSSGLTQGHKTVVFNATNTDVATIWREVRNAVIKASFYLGYHFAW